MRTSLLRASALVLGLLCVLAPAAGASETYPFLATMEVGAATAAALALIATFFSSKREDHGMPRRARRAAVPLAVFLLVIVLQILIPRPDGVPGEGLKTSLASLAPTETLREALKVGAYLIVFLLTARLVTERRRLLMLLTPIAAGAALLAFYGILQLFSGNQLPFIYPKRLWGFDDRLSSTYVNPNHFAGYLEMTIPLALALLFTLKSSESGTSRFAPLRVRIGDFFARAGREPARLFLLIGLTIMGIALIFTGSRMGIFSFVSSIAVLGILLGSREKRRRRLLVLTALILLIFGSSVALGVDPIYQRFSLIEDDAPGRVLVWKDTWDGLKHRYWLTGAGLGSFLFTFPEFQTTPEIIHAEYAETHNDFLNLFWDTGVLGSAPAAIFIGLVLWYLGRTKGRLRGWQRAGLAGGGAGVVAILLHSLTDFNLQVPANGLLFVVCAGVAVGCSSGLPRRRSRSA